MRFNRYTREQMVNKVFLVQFLGISGPDQSKSRNHLELLAGNVFASLAANLTEFKMLR